MSFTIAIMTHDQQQQSINRKKKSNKNNKNKRKKNNIYLLFMVLFLVKLSDLCGVVPHYTFPLSFVGSVGHTRRP